MTDLDINDFPEELEATYQPVTEFECQLFSWGDTPKGGGMKLIFTTDNLNKADAFKLTDYMGVGLRVTIEAKVFDGFGTDGDDG